MLNMLGPIQKTGHESCIIWKPVFLSCQRWKIENLENDSTKFLHRNIGKVQFRKIKCFILHSVFDCAIHSFWRKNYSHVGAHISGFHQKKEWTPDLYFDTKHEDKQQPNLVFRHAQTRVTFTGKCSGFFFPWLQVSDVSFLSRYYYKISMRIVS